MDVRVLWAWTDNSGTFWLFGGYGYEAVATSPAYLNDLWKYCNCNNPSHYTISGTITGLTGSGLVLQDNSGDNLTILPGATTFTFATKIATGGSYSVSVYSEPATPWETCLVSNATGPVTDQNITSVAIQCTINAYTIGGSIMGYTGTGLVLQDNSGNNLSVTSGSASFTFSAPIASLDGYNVTVLTQPTGPVQSCGVSDGMGTVYGENITTVVVTCTTTPTYTLGGMITGLTASGLELTDNIDNLTIAANAGSFTFPTPIAMGVQYSVTVLTQPTSLNCIVTNGTGAMPGMNVTSVQVTCTSALVPQGPWVWISGADTANSDGTGTLGKASTSYYPGSRYGAAQWIDSSGNLWLFGGAAYGIGYDEPGLMNDLWKYSPSTGEWTWISGVYYPGVGGTYGTQGTAASGNTPGGRYYAASWIDTSGNLWLFGGTGYDVNLEYGDLNDMWEFTPSTGLWTWVTGSDTVGVGAIGVYGTQGTAATGNTPGLRDSAATWTDSSGNFWLFGGNLEGFSTPYYTDLWEFSPSTLLWTWVNGPDANTTRSSVNYGQQGTPATTNIPGARGGAATWVDLTGNFWMFGGDGDDSQYTSGYLSDLWEYSPSTNEWTWVNGPDTAFSLGAYGTEGLAVSGNGPGGRYGAASWTDLAGNFWLFGGCGEDGSSQVNYADPCNSNSIDLNDFWEYSLATGYWTWIGGQNAYDVAGVYGMKNTASTNNWPGARDSMVFWRDSAGNLWMFGGETYDNGLNEWFNDLWKY